MKFPPCYIPPAWKIEVFFLDGASLLVDDMEYYPTLTPLQPPGNIL